MIPATNIEDIARRAIDGDREALDRVVRDLQNDVYGLALRMLWNREDAEDATQETVQDGVHRADRGTLHVRPPVLQSLANLGGAPARVREYLQGGESRGEKK